ncbi:MAG: long-chain fatty acid--CoA ligase [Fibrobacteria bacterium]|nr:long-chain fatty acid--CoA ligase [Fibrobacteria bacterium]
MDPTFRTLPELLFQTRSLRFRPDCLVWKEGGAWRELSTSEAETAILEIACGLRRVGIRPGDRVGILAPSSVHWLMFDLGALHLGAVTVPLFDNLAEDHFRLETRDAGISAVLVADEAQLALVRRHCGPEVRILSLGSSAPEGVTTLGALRRGHDPKDLEMVWNDAMALDSSTLATLIYTSGSTGEPKGVELTHGALCSQVRAVFKSFPLDPATDVSLTCLPLAHVFERMVVYYHLASGVRLVFAESIQTVGESMREQRPTVVTVVPRLLEKILERIEAGRGEGGLVKKILLGLALAEAARPRKSPGGPWRALLGALVYKKIRASLGGRMRLIVCGGAPLGARTEGMFEAFGLPIHQGYGLTEHGPVVSANTPVARRKGSVGQAFDGVEIRIAEDGEVLVRSPSVMRGYWNKPEATAESIDPLGFLHTGDLGRIDDDGFLFLTGRKKELCKTAGGKYVAPAPIEELVRQHKGLEHAVICADDRKFVSALVTPDLVAIRRRMQETGFKEDESAFLSKVLRASVQRHIDRLNSRLDSWARIRRWEFVEPFTIAGGDLTPTLKVRREAVLAKYVELLAEFYAGESGAT